jgi:signal-transduction protein with cAMP-binding, CBS, and nucleotidyltransferase domain
MTAGWKEFNPSVKDIDKKKTDIKRILMPLTGIIRLYALREGITSFSSIDRILELYEADRIDARLLHDAIRAWKDLTSMRLTHQASMINRGKDPDNIIDFRAETAEQAFLARQAVLTVNNLVLKAGSDFYTDTI